MRFFIIDDSKTMRNIEKSVLAGLGYTEVGEVGDGKEGLETVEAFAPDVILLDWNMPVMNGLEFVKAFRAKDKLTPVIMVTTESEKTNVLEAIKAGVNNYVVKPFTPEGLSEKINQTIARAKGAA